MKVERQKFNGQKKKVMLMMVEEDKKRLSNNLRSLSLKLCGFSIFSVSVEREAKRKEVAEEESCLSWWIS